MNDHIPSGKKKFTVQVSFSDRELQFIELRYGQSKQLKEIAAKMNISLRTAKYFAFAIYNRLGVSSYVGDSSPAAIKAIKILIKNGIVEL